MKQNENKINSKPTVKKHLFLRRLDLGFLEGLDQVNEQLKEIFHWVENMFNQVQENFSRTLNSKIFHLMHEMKMFFDVEIVYEIEKCWLGWAS